ncbi:unnamed protein product [Gongylonema pulchrum]|uniref:Transthyretin-like family protein n=1 Tax=Gongylonema pulchrum TaxID=637853 RepID=A0A183D9D6_9BILA|nr:unnamed protein product [Gongylonema pulchrum]
MPAIVCVPRSGGAEISQTIAVRGQVKCGFRNVINTKVKLGINIRTAEEQILAIAKTNTTGWFELKASVISVAHSIKPFFKIYVDRINGFKVRHRTVLCVLP